MRLGQSPSPWELAARRFATSDDRRRPKQYAPDGDWRIWLLHPGRGWGKGFTASHWIRDRVRAGAARQIALVGSTAGAVRKLMIEAPTSGILDVCPDAVYMPSRAEVRWPNGAAAHICTADNADEPPLRGGNFDTAWSDEVDSWGHETNSRKAQIAWDNLQLSVRLGDARQIVTSTPKPGRIVAALLQRARDQGDVAITTGSTYENRENLAPEFIAAIEKRYKGTRLERQEIYGEVLDEISGALWVPSCFRYREIVKQHLGRVVVGLDPSGGGEEIGIVAAGQLGDDYGVLDDWSLNGSPATWARRAVDLCEKWGADCIVAEKNFGGDMVESTIKNAGKEVPVRMVTASRSKHVRAEPIALLYEQKRVSHRRGDTAALDLLEAEMMRMTSHGYEGDGSPNRLDAAVWALTELARRGTREVFGFRSMGRS